MILPDPKLLEKHDKNGPRYTSYPSANNFKEINDYINHFKNLHTYRSSHSQLPVNLYIHIPFCEHVCFYCACNKIITRDKSLSSIYLEYLKKEFLLYIQNIQRDIKISQIHLGGGTPTFFSDEQIKILINFIKQNSNLNEIEEMSIEIDPRTIDESRLKNLKKMGFTRVSFGVQDFDKNVQQAVNRVQSYESITEIINLTKSLGFVSTNIDLIYGLPKQNIESFKDTIEKVIKIRPDRIALYSYAHLPDRFKPQTQISKYQLPEAKDKVEMLFLAIKELTVKGYKYIGMDHFALETDSLAKAKQQRRLHRNFQGYSHYPDHDLIPLGVSSIGQIGGYYFQNKKDIQSYYDQIDRNQLPHHKAYSMNYDDIIRRAVIMEIMCQGYVDYETFESSFMVNFKEYFQSELEELSAYNDERIVDIDSEGIALSDVGWFFARQVAMVFDKYLPHNTNLFSKTI